MFYVNYSFGQILYDNGAIISVHAYSIQGNKWNKEHLNYYFQNGTNDIPNNGEREAVREAFKIWSCYTPLNFTEVSSVSKADIIILWGTANHGDSYPFDNQNGVLAHAFFPPPNGEMAGDIHFDDSESWTLNTRSNSSQPMDLITVAAHEIGHSLGLNHTADNKALMYAYYDGSHRFLSSDDINGIQKIYGVKQKVGLPNISELCHSSTKTIKYSPKCSSDIVVGEWNTSSNVQMVSHTNLSVRIRALSSSSTGKGWVKATLSNGIVLREDFDVGLPSSNNLRITTTGNGNYIFPNTCQELFALGARAGDEIEWSVSPSSAKAVDAGGSIMVCPKGGGVSVKMRVKNACGYSPWKHKFLQVYRGPAGIMH